MTYSNNRRGQRRRSRMRKAPLFLAATVLLLSMAMGAALRPAFRAGAGRPGNVWKIRTEQSRDSPGADDWKLLLVNANNPLPDDYAVQTAELQNGLQADERCYPDGKSDSHTMLGSQTVKKVFLTV